mgnify:CR=1 FL=1
MKITAKNTIKGAKVPERKTDGAAGYDLFAAEDGVIYPCERLAIRTGVSMDMGGLTGIIKPRSGLAANYGIDVLAGVIDSDYRGEIKVILINHGINDFKFSAGDRIAQMIFIKPFFPELEIANELSKTQRGAKGFGSTGKAA